MKTKNFIILISSILIIFAFIFLFKGNFIQINLKLPNKTSSTTILSNSGIPQTEQEKIFATLHKCTQETIDNRNLDVFEGWSQSVHYTSYDDKEDEMHIYNYFSTQKDPNSFFIKANVSKVYITDQGITRLVKKSDYDSNDYETFWNYKVYYKVVTIDNSLANQCPNWEENLNNAYIYKVIVQKSKVNTQQSISTSTNWSCPNNEYIKIENQNIPIIATDITGSSGCNIKFSNSKNYTFIRKCDWLSRSMINSIKMTGDTVCSPFNNICIFDTDDVYFDTLLTKDEKNNVYFDNFTYNSKDFDPEHDKQEFELTNYSPNAYWKSDIKTPINKYYLYDYVYDSNSCSFFSNSILIDITDSIQGNTSLIWLIKEVEDNQVNNKKSDIIDEDGINIALNGSGKLYCGNIDNFMDYDNYSCVFRPAIINITNISY